MKKLHILALALLFVLLFCHQALAEGFAVYEWSARGLALGGATVARKADPSAIAANPAAITQLKGQHIQANLSAVMPRGKLRLKDSGEEEKIKNASWFMPGIYYTQEINEHVYLGIGEFSRFGLGVEMDENWSGRYNTYNIRVQSASFNPNLACKLTDSLSAAVGVELMYLTFLKKKKIKNPYNTGDIDVKVTADNTAMGVNFATHYKFNDNWALGVSYRSPVTHSPQGDAKIKSPAAIPGLVDQDVSAKVTLPESVAFGLAWTPIPEFSLEAGGIWTRWSRFKALDLNFDILGEVKDPKDWKNTWRFTMGAEYIHDNWLALRLGFVWDQSPVTDKYADYMVPTQHRTIYSTGVGFIFDNWTVDLTFAYLTSGERDYKSIPSNGTLESRTKSSKSYLSSIGFGYSF